MIGAMLSHISPHMDTRGSEVTRDENSVPGGTQSSQKARGIQVDGHEILERFLSETFYNILVVLHHIRGDAAVQRIGRFHSVMNRIFNQRPSREWGAGHQNCSVKKSWNWDIITSQLIGIKFTKPVIFKKFKLNLRNTHRSVPHLVIFIYSKLKYVL